jgi:hypothetical protein
MNRAKGSKKWKWATKPLRCTPHFEPGVLLFPVVSPQQVKVRRGEARNMFVWIRRERFRFPPPEDFDSSPHFATDPEVSRRGAEAPRRFRPAFVGGYVPCSARVLSIRIRRASRRGRGGVFDLPLWVGMFHALHPTFFGGIVKTNHFSRLR